MVNLIIISIFVLNFNDSLKKTILIVPNESKLYFSDIDKEIAKTEKLEINKLKYIFRQAVADIFETKLNKNFKAINLLKSNVAEYNKELPYIYKSILYDYKDITEKKIKEIISRNKNIFFNKKNSKSKDKNNNPGIVPISNFKYRKTLIRNNNLLNILYSKFNYDYIIFISELDFLKTPAESQNLTKNNNLRTFQIHYTIYKNDGVLLNDGIVRVFFPETDNKINHIANFVIGKAIDYIISKIPVSIKLPENPLEQY